MKERKIRLYDKEFKLNAVKLYLESGESYKKVSDDLGIPCATLDYADADVVRVVLDNFGTHTEASLYKAQCYGMCVLGPRINSTTSVVLQSRAQGHF